MSTVFVHSFFFVIIIIIVFINLQSFVILTSHHNHNDVEIKRCVSSRSRFIGKKSKTKESQENKIPSNKARNKNKQTCAWSHRFGFCAKNRLLCKKLITTFFSFLFIHTPKAMSRPKRERKKSTHYGDFITEKEMDELGKRSSERETSSRPVTRSSTLSRKSKPVVVSVGETNCTFQVNSRKRKNASSLVISSLEQDLPSVGDFRLFEIQDSAINEAKEWQLATVRRKPFPTAASTSKRGSSSSSSSDAQDGQDTQQAPPEKKKRKRNIPKLIKEV